MRVSNSLFRRSALISLLAATGCAPAATPVAPPPVPAPAPTAETVAPPEIRVAPSAPPIALCGRGTVRPAADGRLFHHFRYPDTPASALVPVPPTLSPGGSCRVHPAMLPDLARLLDAAGSDPTVAGQLRAISCHRSEPLQAQTFCGGIGPDGSAGFADRAWASAPPGHSEHATGYVIDFGTIDRPACHAEACFAATAAGRWLRANAPRYGFEMSFPAGNRQQVKWEPWHWRWVGTATTVPGATVARTLFAPARIQFPADPSVE